MIAKQVLYSGRVQGVGFRYSARQIASGYEVTGWVKNLPDGRVEMQVMAADGEELEGFLQEILDSNLGSLIREQETKSIPALTGVKGFTIVR
ncbi:MAG: acylphosphatase [Verrucomicrobiales bacterium]|nr:acylphosphatase [Verrucomicrobiales bacterium]